MTKPHRRRSPPCPPRRPSASPASSKPPPHARTTRSSGRAWAALAAYDEALRLVPDLALATVGQARALAATGQTSSAIDALSELVDRRPAPESAALLGELQTADEAIDAAADSFALARTMYDLQAAYDERRTIFTADALAWSLHRAGHSDEAAPFAEESIARGAPEPSIRVHSAAVLAAVGRTDDAATVLAPAIDLGGWLAPTVRPVAADLAVALDLDLPERWR